MEEKGEEPLSGLDGISSHFSAKATEPVCQNGFSSPISSTKGEGREQNLKSTGLMSGGHLPMNPCEGASSEVTPESSVQPERLSMSGARLWK